MTSVGENIKNIRKKIGITQEELAEKLSVTRQAVSNWENGKTEPDIETLTKIAQIFDIGIDELVDGIPKDIKELRGKKSHLYVGIIFTAIYIISSLLMIIFEDPINDYYGRTYDAVISALCVLIWKPLTIVSGGIGISALVSYITGYYIKNKKVRTVLTAIGTVIFLFTTGFFIVEFLGIHVFRWLSVIHFMFIDLYVFLIEHPILHILGPVFIFFGIAKK